MQRKITEVIAPLFPRYLFVSFDQEITPWRSINYTKGVSYLLTSKNGSPSTLKEEIILDIKSKENEDGIVNAGGLNIFQKGQKVVIKDGSFKDQTAEFLYMDENYRVEVLLTLLGNPTKIKINLSQIESV